jgi:hypothetical protein
MKIIPTDYKIEHDLNEHTYYIVRRMSLKYNNKWFVTMYDRNAFLVESDMGWSSWTCDEHGYNTPEEALEAWERYIKTKGY